ncbi:hypothetical protein DESC_610273 [Desulfosarcina cetonica]|nr:hypothetical protein DESC_610273 [Desulfosarcina cetonica]
MASYSAGTGHDGRLIDNRFEKEHHTLCKTEELPSLRWTWGDLTECGPAILAIATRLP